MLLLLPDPHAQLVEAVRHDGCHGAEVVHWPEAAGGEVPLSSQDLDDDQWVRGLAHLVLHGLVATGGR